MLVSFLCTQTLRTQMEERRPRGAVENSIVIASQRMQFIGHSAFPWRLRELRPLFSDQDSTPDIFPLRFKLAR